MNGRFLVAFLILVTACSDSGREEPDAAPPLAPDASYDANVPPAPDAAPDAASSDAALPDATPPDATPPDATPLPDAPPGAPDAAPDAMPPPPSICGDGIVEAGEQCDDGNAASGDCCSASCQLEQGCETESNNDPATADPVETHFVNDTVTGFISPVGDVDFYVLTLPAGTAQWSLHLQTIDGPFSTCASNHIDSDIRLDNATSTLAENDDAGGNFCSIVDKAVPPGTYFIRVAASTSAGPNDHTFDYRLKIAAAAVICGDGVRSGDESCDDGNTVNGDGCSSDCRVESFPEVEPNNDAHSASGPLVLGTPAQGAITPVGDKDYYTFVVPAVADVRLETFDLTGPGNCATIDTFLRLYGQDGTTELVTDDDDGPGNCSAINATSDAGARHLAPGTYYVSVEEFNNDNTVLPGYLLALHFDALCGNGTIEGSEECDGAAGVPCDASCQRVPVCGDGHIDDPEQCDDSNTAAGDGCSPTCQREQQCGNGHIESPEQCDDGNMAPGDGCDASCNIEAGHIFESEPNGTTAVATPVGAPPIVAHGSLAPAGDKDVFAFTVGSTSDVTVETFDGTGAPNCGAGVDTLIQLIGADGTTQLASDDDDGPGNCSAINATSDAGARRLAPGTYYVQVANFSATATLAAYTLRISFSAVCGNGMVEGSEECDGVGGPPCDASCQRIPVCGDGQIDDPEQCDDGNTTPGDGCDATCQREQRCGNGHIEMGEQCDDGNTAPGDGCDATCAIETGHAFEVEPNGNSTTATPADPGTRMHASITPAGDQDYYRVKLSAPASLRFETFDGSGMATCAGGMDTVITLFSANGTTQIGTDDDSGPNSCSKLDSTNLPAGTYYLRVEEYQNNGVIPAYQLVITQI